MPRVVWLLVAARSVNRLGAFTLPFLTVLLTQSFGASVGQAGLVMALFGLATIPSRLFGGWLADHLGRRTTIVAGLVGCAAGQLLVAGATDVRQAAGAAVLLGLAFEIYESPSQAMIADVVDGPDRPAAYGLMASGLALAGMAAGLMAVALGQVDLRLLFVADAVSCLLCALLVRLTLPGGRPTADASDGTASRSPWRDRLLLALLATGTGFAVVYLQLVVTLPLTLLDRGLGAHQLGLLLTVSAATIVVGQPLLSTSLLRRHDPTTALAGGYVLLGLGLAAYGFVDSVVGFVLATVVSSLGDLVLLGRAQAVVADLAPTAARGRYLAVYGVSWGVAAVVGPLLGTTLFERAGATTLWLGCAVLCSTLAVGQLLLRRPLAQRCDARHAMPG